MKSDFSKLKNEQIGKMLLSMVLDDETKSPIFQSLLEEAKSRSEKK